MPTDSTHADYDANLNAWLRARDVFAGEDTLKSAGVRYLPRLDSQTDEEYLAYKSRTSFFNAAARTADGFVGLIFRRDPTFKLPDGKSGVGAAMTKFLDDADTRMLESQKRVGESADAIELRQSGENSVLSAVSISVGDSLTQVLRWVYWWNSTEATPDVIGEELVLAQLNSDFGTKGMASDEITAIVAAWQANAISRETMFELFRKGEVLPAGRSNQEELRLVGANPKEKQITNETTQPEVLK